MSVSLRLIDAAAAEAIVAGRCPPGCRCAPDYPDETDRIAALMLLERHAADVDVGPFGTFQICRPDGLVVGGIGFHGEPDVRGRVEIGYGVAASQRRRGYASAALRALVDLARELGVRTLVAETEPSNLASRSVLLGCGFTRVAGDAHATYFERPLADEA